jgi:hypothetical protein
MTAGPKQKADRIDRLSRLTDERTSAPAEHCDWCGEELGNVRHWIRASWLRNEYIGVHPHCVEEVLGKNRAGAIRSLNIDVRVRHDTAWRG